MLHRGIHYPRRLSAECFSLFVSGILQKGREKAEGDCPLEELAQTEQLSKEYRENSEIAQLEAPGRRFYAEYPPNLKRPTLSLRNKFPIWAKELLATLRCRLENYF
jgi:hypothetical protein